MASKETKLHIQMRGESAAIRVNAGPEIVLPPGQVRVVIQILTDIISRRYHG